MTTTQHLPVRSGSWQLDINHSAVGFTIRHLGVSKVRGRFGRFTTDVVVGDSLRETTLEATIDVASIDTGNADRDAHVLSPDILDVTARPTMTYRSTSITGEGDTWRVDGVLSIGGVTVPTSLDLEFGGVETFMADGSRHAGFTATTTLKRSDFGIAPGIPAMMLGDRIDVEIDVQLVEPAS